jgi:DNA-binding NarL/FixJ family response regulator
MGQEKTYIVAVLEDDFLLAGLLKDRVNAIEGFTCRAVFANPLQFLAQHEPVDIILLDIMMPEMNGLDAIGPILKKYPDVSIIMNTIKDDPETIFEALQKGALGYVDKQSYDISLEDVLRTVAGGGAYMTPKIARKVCTSFQKKASSPTFENLTPRENDVTLAILDGLSYKMIAARFGISIDTVRMNVKNVYRKLNINSKGELFKLSKS